MVKRNFCISVIALRYQFPLIQYIKKVTPARLKHIVMSTQIKSETVKYKCMTYDIMTYYNTLYIRIILFSFKFNFFA